MLDDELLEIGSQAEQAKPYVEALFKRVEGTIFDKIMALNVDETLKFTVYKSHILCINDLMSTVEADIRAGQRVIEIMQGEDTNPNQGIL